MRSPIAILFIIFNRKDVSIKSFAKIAQTKPDRLYISGDGPRLDKIGEEHKVKETRDAILSLINWKCEVKTLFHNDNLGCSKGVYTAINWFFDNEKMGIILEDDCVVQDSFFPYMSSLLHLYENDNRIGMISGYNKLNTSLSPFSYCFSKYKSCWGWGTWKRAWLNMDISLSWRNTSQANNIINNMGYKGKDKREWLYKLKKIEANSVSAWDWQWYFALSSQHQLCIFPSVSLVSNIGYGIDATHTTNYTKNMLASNNLSFPLNHPIYITPNSEFDKKFYQKDSSVIRKLRTFLPISLNKNLKKLF